MYLLRGIDITYIDCVSLPTLQKNLDSSKYGFSNIWIRVALVGQLLVNLYISQNLIFVTLSPSMYPTSMVRGLPYS